MLLRQRKLSSGVSGATEGHLSGLHVGGPGRTQCSHEASGSKRPGRPKPPFPELGPPQFPYPRPALCFGLEWIASFSSYKGTSLFLSQLRLSRVSHLNLGAPGRCPWPPTPGFCSPSAGEVRVLDCLLRLFLTHCGVCGAMGSPPLLDQGGQGSPVSSLPVGLQASQECATAGEGRDHV